MLMQSRRMLYLLCLWMIFSLLPMIIGGGLLIIRDGHVILFDWLCRCSLYQPEIWNLLPSKNFFAVVILNNLITALWVFSTTNALILVWHRYNLIVLCPTFAAILLECMQYLHWWRGTFDTLDVVAYLLSSLCSYVFYVAFIRSESGTTCKEY